MFKQSKHTTRKRVSERAKADRYISKQRSRAIRRTNWNTPRSREEKKWLDIAVGNSVADTTGAVTLLNGLTNGATYQTREGRQCWIRNIQIRGCFHPVDSTTEPCRGDLYLIYDRQPGAAVPNITDVLNASTSAAFINLNNRDRFKILCHRAYTIGKQDNTATQSLSAHPGAVKVEIFLKCNLKETFKGDTNAITDISYGAIYMLTIGDQAANAGGTFWVACRIRFSEK